jgi:hypothetical protein
VYRFFDDKEAIAEALALRYWRDFDENRLTPERYPRMHRVIRIG